MRRTAIISFSVALALTSLSWAQGSRDEERKDPYKDWLTEDVAYIISKEEKDVFEKLTTDEEKQAFIEQFWRNRDPDPSTPRNEFREEHFRRIAYANEKYHSGKDGWRTDRGMVYIKFGPPDRKSSNPTGGRVYRSQRELQASGRAKPKDAMTALPHEVWEYRYLPGLGAEVRFEFVSKDGASSNYELVMDADEKDALFYLTGSRIMAWDRSLGLKTYGGTNLDRIEAHARAFRPLPATVDQSFVSAQVSVEQFPFEVKSQSGYLGDESYCDVAVIVPHRSLSFNGKFEKYVARVELEIFVRDIRKIVVGHKADSLETSVPKANFKKAAAESSAYQTRFVLPPGRFLLEVWVKDVHGGLSSFQQKLVVIERPADTGSD